MTALHILGGGPAGLAAAQHAHARGIPFTLHEAGAETGGNCRTLRIGDCLFDTGAHRLHLRDPEAARAFHKLLGTDLITVEAPSRIVREGRSFRFPLAIGDLVRNLRGGELLRIGWELLTRRGRREDSRYTEKSGMNFHDLAVGRYGKTLADLFLLGYTRKLWGRDPALLSPAVAGGRLDGLNARTVLMEKLRAIPSKLFNGRAPRPGHLDGVFLYPKHGIGSLFRALENQLPTGAVRTRSRVTRIRHEGTLLRSVTVNDGDDVAVEQVVSTLPLPAFLRALDPPPPPEILKAADAVAFRNLVLCVLRLETDRFSENASLYFPGPETPFTRLYEPRNRSPFMAPRGQTCVVLEIPCDPHDALWSAPDATVVEKVLAHLSLAKTPVLETAVYRIGHAYPVLERGSEARIATLLEYCARFSNLRMAGRNALFRYAHIHDMFRQGREAVDALAGTSERKSRG